VPFSCLRCERVAAGQAPGVPFHHSSCPLRGKDPTEGQGQPEGPFARALDVVVGSQDCPHAPACSVETGCHEGAVPREWVVLHDLRDGRWIALSWQHPREATMHRSTVGEQLDRPPKWAR
jgi:hypothetical protein